MEKRKFTLSFALCLAFALLLTFAAEAFLPVKEQKIYSEVIRLHVIADSDEDADQNVKLLVRDAILEKAPDLFGGADIGEASAIAASSCEEIEMIADEVLAENGFAYRSEAVLACEEYPTREYDGITFPAGKYLSLQVKLGSAEGHNWWCVLFPPLCLGSSSVIVRTSKEVAEAYSEKTVKHKIRLKILELFG